MSKYPKVKFGDFVEHVVREIELEADKDYPSVGVKWYGEGVHVHEVKSGGSFNAARFAIKENDIIYNDMWARNGSVAIVPRHLDGAVASSHFPTFLPDTSRVLSKYLQYYFKTPTFWEDCESASRGSTGRNQIKKSTFYAIEIPLPSLGEQRRIVERVETLAARITKAQTLRKGASDEVENFINHSLKYILKPKENWVTKTIAEVSTMSTGTTPPSHQLDYYGGKILWYTPGDLGFDKELGKSTRTLTELAVNDRKARIFQPGTILLVAIGGSMGKVGLARVECSSNQQITGILFDSEIFPDYGFWWMRRLYDEIRETAPQATLPIINQRGIGAFNISYPPLDEQRRIVEYLDSVQARLASLRELQSATGEELSALLPSVLDKAFKGEL